MHCPLSLLLQGYRLDEEYENDNDTFQYRLGRMDQHHSGIISLPASQIGINSTATVAAEIRSKFPALQFYLMVGIGGGCSEQGHRRSAERYGNQPATWTLRRSGAI